MSFVVTWVLIQMLLTKAQVVYQPIFWKSCMDVIMNGQHPNGYYQISGAGEQTLTVYCDFNSEPGSVWTLVMSWSFEYRELPAFRSKSLTQDAPVNELSPNWEVYRMSRDQMKSLRGKSTHWRATCQFDTMDVDYKDYVRGNFAAFDITRWLGWSCKEVDYINIRGTAGVHTKTVFWQKEDSFSLHAGSGYGNCEFKVEAENPLPGVEDNFGYYVQSTDAFRCTSDSSATTQYWFGSYI